MPIRHLKGYINELFYTYLICRLIASANSSGLLVYIGHSINWKYTPLNKCLLSHFISQSLIFRVPRSGFLPIIYLAALSEDLLTLYINVALVVGDRGRCSMWSVVPSLSDPRRT